MFNQKLVRALALLCILSFPSLLGGCRENSWDPEVAVLVGDESIPKAAVDRVLELGFHPILAEGDQPDGAVAIKQVLDKLIDEKLLLMEAKSQGLTVNEKELNEAIAEVKDAWSDTPLSEDEFREIKETLRNQLLLRKITWRIIAEKRVLSAAEWRAFWAGWPKGPEAGPRYKVRALILPPLSKPPLGLSGSNLESVAQKASQRGLTFLLSDPFWITASSLKADDFKRIEQTAAQSGSSRLTPPMRLAESWAVYEVLESSPGYDPAQDILAAQAAFERQAGEEAYQDWLAETRRNTRISINPALLDVSQAAQPGQPGQWAEGRKPLS